MKLSRRPETVLQVTQEALDRIACLVEARYGLSPAVLEQRLRGYLAQVPTEEQTHLADQLAANHETNPVWQSLIEGMLVHETYFYRHMNQLKVVTQEVFPLLRRPKQANIMAWCAGCSTGEEAYTLTFMLRASGIKSRVTGTDLSARSIATARQGIFRQTPGLNSFRAMPNAAWSNFVASPDDRATWTVTAEIRGAVEFTVHNLVSPFPGGSRMDLISCRNTLIYFSAEGQRRVEANIVAASGPGTVLLLGPAERLRFTDVFVPLSNSHPQILHWPIQQAG